MRGLLVLCGLLFAFKIQAKNIEGWVYNAQNNKESLIGVNVYWMGTTQGTATNHEGYFSIQKPNEAHMLIVSFVGYENDTIHIDGNKALKIYLKPGKLLNEVTVNERTKATTISKINPILAQQITTKELNRFACCNLSESFETNASVDVAYSDAVSGVKQIKLLGLSGRYSQMMLENIPILRGAETAFGLDYIPGTWMHSIQVSKGTSAVKNGYESVTGQINVHFKQPDGEEKMHFYTYTNQDGKIESNASYAFKVNDNWSSAVLVHAGTSYTKLDMNKDGFLDRPHTSVASVMNRWNYMGKNTEAKIGITYLGETRKGGQVAFDHSKKASEQDAYGINIEVQKLHAFAKVGFLFDRPHTSLGTIWSMNYFDRNSFYGKQVFNAEQLNGYGNIVFQSYFYNTAHTFNTGISTVVDQNELWLNQDDRSYTEIVPGAFFEYNYKPADHFTLMAGIRYDHSSKFGGFVTPRLHAKYRFPAYLTIRASAGKGYRTANALSENSSLLASSRQIYFDENIQQEEAWNYGLSLVNDIPIGEKELTLTLEYFRTDFMNQLVVDLEQSSQEVHFYNLNGTSFANSIQAELMYELFERFDLTAAYRINDVQSTFNGVQKQVPFMSKYKGLLSAGYSTNLDKWKFDLTAQFHGASRLPGVYENSAEQNKLDPSKDYINLIAQVTKNYRNWSFYVGAENLTNFTQKNPILSVENPFSDTFDASMVWGPVYGRMLYAGVKLIINKD